MFMIQSTSTLTVSLTAGVNFEGPALLDDLPAAPFMSDNGKARPQRERDFDVTPAIADQYRTAQAAHYRR